MKNKISPPLIIVGMIFIVAAFIAVTTIIEHNTPTTEQADYNEYYEISNNSQIPIIYNQQISGSFGTSVDGAVYLNFEWVYHYLNSRFYWSPQDNTLFYTTAEDIISVTPDQTTYLAGEDTVDFGQVILRFQDDTLQIHLGFLQQYTHMNCRTYTSPNRIVIENVYDRVSFADTKADGALRVENHIKSPILSQVSAQTPLIVLEEGEHWTKVCSMDGFLGYVENSILQPSYSDTIDQDYVPETFDHLLMDEPVNLLWHQVTNTTANNKITSLLANTKGVNVVCPTWFRIKDNDGNISGIASKDYVRACHQQGIQVWGLITNFEESEVNTSQVLSNTASRQQLIQQLLSAALEYDLDGINIDFEYMDSNTIGDSYIQFLRELSILCKEHNLILSTDVPVPASYNNHYQYKEQSYFVDYIIVMGYDEHYGERSGEGSVASLNWTKEALDDLKAMDIPSNQVVLGMPFYTKLWKLTPTYEENAAEITYKLTFENLPMTKAKNWMTTHVSEPVWLEECGQYYGETKIDDVIYKMWLEDATSLEKRLQLMTSYKLAGAAFWKYDLESPDIWDLIPKYLN